MLKPVALGVEQCEQLLLGRPHASLFLAQHTECKPWDRQERQWGQSLRRATKWTQQLTNTEIAITL